MTDDNYKSSSPECSKSNPDSKKLSQQQSVTKPTTRQPADTPPPDKSALTAIANSKLSELERIDKSLITKSKELASFFSIDKKLAETVATMSRAVGSESPKSFFDDPRYKEFEKRRAKMYAETTEPACPMKRNPAINIEQQPTASSDGLIKTTLSENRGEKVKISARTIGDCWELIEPKYEPDDFKRAMMAAFELISCQPNKKKISQVIGRELQSNYALQQSFNYSHDAKHKQYTIEESGGLTGLVDGEAFKKRCKRLYQEKS